MKKIILIILAIILSLFFIYAILIINGFILIANPSISKYHVRGIDISHHNGEIGWKKIDKKEIDFVIIKATEGDDLVDHMFSENWKIAGETGLIKGAYHYYSLRIEGKKQAENFIKTVPVEAGNLPPFVDIEFGGNSKLRPEKSGFIKELKIFLITLEKRYDKKPVLYSTNEFYDKYISGELQEYDLWIRNIFYEPGLMKDGRKWLFWQYTGRGNLKGVKGFTDYNVFKGDEKAFHELLK
jgi:lysozyme